MKQSESYRMQIYWQYMRPMPREHRIKIAYLALLKAIYSRNLNNDAP